MLQGEGKDAQMATRAICNFQCIAYLTLALSLPIRDARSCSPKQSLEGTGCVANQTCKQHLDLDD